METVICMLSKEKRILIFKRILQIMPWVMGIALLFFVTSVFLEHPDISAEDVVEYAPKNEFLAALFIILLFAVKSLVFIIPIPFLYISSGLIFSPVTAFIVNILGAIVCTAVPYWIGWYSGAGIINRLTKKYPRLQVLDTFKNENQWFLSFFIRVIGFLPCDAVSVMLGAWKIDFKKYITGTALGMLPGLITTTLIGITITDPRSPKFILSLVLSVLVTVGSIVFYKIYLKLRKTKGQSQ